MVLDTRVSELATRVGEEIVTLRAEQAKDLPTYAPTGLTKSWEAHLCLFNAGAQPFRHVSRAKARVLNGGKMDIVVLGDSGVIGSDGTTTLERNSLGERLAAYIADSLGKRLAGTGLSPAVPASGIFSDRWSSTGTVTKTGPYAWMSAGSTLTFTSLVAGTSVDVYYSGKNPAFSYTVDGGAVQNVAAGPNTDTVHKHTGPSGLADTVHTVVITAPSNNTFIMGVHVGRTSGVAGHSLGYGGTTAAWAGNTDVSWTATTDTNGVYLARKLMLDASGITPDLVIINLGTNDIWRGDTAVNAIAGLETMVNWFPNSDVMLTQMWENVAAPATDMTIWNDYCRRKYLLAQAEGVSLMDWRWKFGDQAALQADGVLGADNLHPAHGLSVEMARTIANALGISGDFQRVVTSYAGAPFSHLDNDTLFVEF